MVKKELQTVFRMSYRKIVRSRSQNNSARNLALRQEHAITLLRLLTVILIHHRHAGL